MTWVKRIELDETNNLFKFNSNIFVIADAESTKTNCIYSVFNTKLIKLQQYFCLRIYLPLVAM